MRIFLQNNLLVEAANMATNLGSSTWVIAILNPRDHTVHTTLLGDSSYMLLRPDLNGDLIKLYRSEEQQHSFNYPYQWGTNGDDPSLAIDVEHKVQHNDIIVLGSDGIFDNWFDNEIINIIKSSINNQGELTNIQETTNLVAKLAENHGMDDNWRSPFQINAEKTKRYRRFKGGKQDDISIIISQIKFEK